MIVTPNNLQPKAATKEDLFRCSDLLQKVLAEPPFDEVERLVLLSCKERIDAALQQQPRIGTEEITKLVLARAAAHHGVGRRGLEREDLDPHELGHDGVGEEEAGQDDEEAAGLVFNDVQF